MTNHRDLRHASHGITLQSKLAGYAPASTTPQTASGYTVTGGIATPGGAGAGLELLQLPVFPTTPTLTVSSSGTIANGGLAVYIPGSLGGVLINSGSISGTSDAGVKFLVGPGTVTNNSSGRIAGYGGIEALGGSVTLSNAGVITSSGYNSRFAGVYLKAGGTVSNTGTIANTGGGRAVHMVGSGTLTNQGTISTSGSGDAVVLAGGNSRVIDKAGSVFVGRVSANGTGNVLELATGTSSFGTMSGLGTQFVGFSNIVADAGVTWVFAGGNAITSGQTLTANGDLMLKDNMSIGGKAVMAAGTSLYMFAGASLTGTISAAGTNNALVLTGPAGSSGTITGLGAQLKGFNSIQEYGTITWTLAGPTTIAASQSLTANGTLVLAGNMTVNGTATLAHNAWLVMRAGTVLTGTISTANTGIGLELASGTGTGTLSGLGTQLAGFTSITEDAGAIWAISNGTTVTSKQSLTSTGTLLLAGSLTVSGTASMSGSARLVLAAGASIAGHISAAGGATTLELASGTGTGTLSGLGISLSGFKNIVEDAGAIWLVSGPSSIASGQVLTVNGSLAVTDGLSLAGSMTVNGTASLGANASFGMSAGAALNGTIVAAGTNNLLQLQSGVGTGTLSGLGSQLRGFTDIVINSSWNLSGNNSIATNQSALVGGALSTDGVLTNAGKMVGQYGITPIFAELGRDGTAALSVNSGTTTNTGTIAGGAGSSGWSAIPGATSVKAGTTGGNGGVGVFLNGGTVTNSGIIYGGAGGTGGNGGSYTYQGSNPPQAGGNGGNGGTGLQISGGTLNNSGFIRGGAAGAAGSGGAYCLPGHAGKAGVGVMLTGGAMTNTGQITGGGYGGAGVYIKGGIVYNRSQITGGAGGGVGVYINGGTLVNNSFDTPGACAMISGTNGAAAVKFGSAAGTLVLGYNVGNYILGHYSFSGVVQANANDTLMIGGPLVAPYGVVAAAGIGTRFVGFGTIALASESSGFLFGDNVLTVGTPLMVGTNSVLSMMKGSFIGAVSLAGNDTVNITSQESFYGSLNAQGTGNVLNFAGSTLSGLGITITGFSNITDYGAALTGSNIIGAGQTLYLGGYASSQGNTTNNGTINGAESPEICLLATSGVVTNNGLIQSLTSPSSAIGVTGVKVAGASVFNNGTIIGGNNGGYSGYTGGTGVLITSGTMVNAGSITGGAATNGPGGVGVVMTGGMLTNAGTISGIGGANAVSISGVATLVVEGGAVFNGAVAGGNYTGATLVLDKGGIAGSTLSGLGSSITGFSTITEVAGANWAIATAALNTSQAVGISVGGTLALKTASAIIKDANGTVSVSGKLSNAGTVIAGSLAVGSTGSFIDSGSASFTTLNTQGAVSIKGTLSDGATTLTGSKGKLTVSGAKGAFTTASLTLQGGALSNAATSSAVITGGGAVSAVKGSIVVGNAGTISGFGKVSGAIIDNGRIAAVAGVGASQATLTLTGAVAGTGTLAIGSGATLVQTGAMSGVAINFTAGSKETLVLGAPSLVTSTISGFGGSDVIVLKGLTATSLSFAGGALTVLNGATVVDTLFLAGSYTTANFRLASDGHGGEKITWVAAASAAAAALPLPEAASLGGASWTDTNPMPSLMAGFDQPHTLF